MEFPGVTDSKPMCPVCQSEQTEQVDGMLVGLSHRCVNCSVEFDATGGRIRF